MDLSTQNLRGHGLAVDDDDELHFCSTCAFSRACLEAGYDKPRLRELDVIVEHVGPFREGQHIFREGDEFKAIVAVRAGTVKSYVTDLNGREQVREFFLPGELVGLDAISRSRYPCNAIALDTVLMCRFSFPAITTLAARMPGLQQELLRQLSANIRKATLLSGDFTAEERLAAFLVILSRRYQAQGLSATRLHLTMARTDIANYLRLAAETVSRQLRRFHEIGLLDVEGREVEITDLTGLEAVAMNVLRDRS